MDDKIKKAIEFLWQSFKAMDNTELSKKIRVLQASHTLNDYECTRKYNTESTYCRICSILDCPGHSPYHYWKQGCPYCNPDLEFLCPICKEIPIKLKEGQEQCESCRIPF